MELLLKQLREGGTRPNKRLWRAEGFASASEAREIQADRHGRERDRASCERMKYRWCGTEFAQDLTADGRPYTACSIGAGQAHAQVPSVEVRRKMHGWGRFGGT